MLNKIKSALGITISLLPCLFSPVAYGAAMKGEADTWSTEQFSIYPEDYEAMEPIDVLSLDPAIQEIIAENLEPLSEVDRFQQLSLAMLEEDSGTSSYFQNLIDSVSQITISGTTSADEAYVPILPQVGYSQIFRGVYDFRPSAPRRRDYISIRRPGFAIRRSQYSRISSVRGRDIFYSTELSDFGNPQMASNLPEKPQNELLIAVRRYSDNVSELTPMIGSFGTLAIDVELPSLPTQTLATGLEKYFEMTEADEVTQNRLERQAREQAKEQKQLLKRLGRNQRVTELRRGRESRNQF